MDYFNDEYEPDYFNLNFEIRASHDDTENHDENHDENNDNFDIFNPPVNSEYIHKPQEHEPQERAHKSQEYPHKIKDHAKINKMYNKIREYITSNKDNKPTCKICRKSFANRPNLIRHIRIHLRDSSYKCKVCGRTFNQSSNRNSHMYRVHINEWIDYM
jgi:transposase-like protein